MMHREGWNGIWATSTHNPAVQIYQASSNLRPKYFTPNALRCDQARLNQDTVPRDASRHRLRGISPWEHAYRWPALADKPRPWVSSQAVARISASKARHHALVACVN